MIPTRLIIVFLLVAAGRAKECVAHTATYDAATGNVRLEWDGGVLGGMGAWGPGVPAVAPPESFGGFYDLSTPHQVNWLLFHALSSPVDLIGIVPAALSHAMLAESYSSYIIIQGAGGEPEFMTWEYIPVPEPSSGLLCLVASVATVLTARRRVS